MCFAERILQTSAMKKESVRSAMVTAERTLFFVKEKKRKKLESRFFLHGGKILDWLRYITLTLCMLE
jgi:hypothetical protein